MDLISTLGWTTIIVAFSVLLSLVITETIWWYVVWSDDRAWKRYREEWRRREEEMMREECEKLFTTRQNSSNEELEEKP